jgi:hypothetical protein
MPAIAPGSIARMLRDQRPRYACTPKRSIAHRMGSMMPAASGGAMNTDISGTAIPPAPAPNPPLAIPVSRIATTATG